MKAADRFRVFEALHGIARENVHVSIHRERLVLIPAGGNEVTAYARSCKRRCKDGPLKRPDNLVAAV
jgi:hypothetical protein